MKAFSLCASALVMLLPAHASAGQCEPNALAKKYAGMHGEDQAWRGRYMKILEAQHRGEYRPEGKRPA